MFIEKLTLFRHDLHFCTSTVFAALFVNHNMSTTAIQPLHCKSEDFKFSKKALYMNFSWLADKHPGYVSTY